MYREKQLNIRLVRCRTRATNDFHRRNTKSSSEYKDSRTEYIEIWILGYPMGINRIPIHIIGPLYSSLWVEKNGEIMKLNWQRWNSNKSQQCETSAIKKQVKYHNGTAIQREVKTPWLCHKKHLGTNSDIECVSLELMSKGQILYQKVRVWHKHEKRKLINSLTVKLYRCYLRDHCFLECIYTFLICSWTKNVRNKLVELNDKKHIQEKWEKNLSNLEIWHLRRPLCGII